MEREKIAPEMYIEELALVGSFRKIRLLLPDKEKRLQRREEEIATISKRKETVSRELNELNVKLKARREEYVHFSKQVEAKKIEFEKLDRMVGDRSKRISELDGLLRDKDAPMEEIVERARANLLPIARVFIRTKDGILPLALRAVMQALRRNGRFRSLLINLAEQGFDPNRLDRTSESFCLRSSMKAMII